MSTYKRKTSFLHFPAVIGILVATGGCGTDDVKSVDDAGSSSDAGPVVTNPSSPTYYRDVAPILQAQCVTCHSAGQIAPMVLDTPEAARAWADVIKESTSAGTMPPWPPGPLSPALLHTRRLTESQVATLAAWADAKAPLGDAKNPAPAGVAEVVDIGVADMQMDIGVDYVPDPALSDDYRCFLVDVGATENHVITGYRITPGNRKTVHHVITTLFSAEDKAALQALDQASPDRAGWSCFGGPVPADSDLRPAGSLGSWVPGVSSVVLPAGTGNALRAGDLAVVQIHYNVSGGGGPDRTRIEIKFAPKATETSLQQLATLRLAKRDLILPANQGAIVQQNTLTAHVWAGGKFYADGEARIVMVAGHMHTLGTRITIERKNALGTTVLLDIPAWDFHWQGTYLLAQPIPLRANDQLTVRCTFDNTTAQREANGWGSVPVTDIRWGEGTHDEMCIGYVSVVD